MKKLILISLLFLFGLKSQEQELPLSYQIKFEDTISDKATITNVYNYAIAIGIKYPKIFIAQVIEETGWLKSRVFKKTHNLCGMNYTSNRFAIGKYKGYAKYKSWKDSVKAYKKWQDERYKQANDYFEFLCNLNYADDNQQAQVYAENPNYVNNLRSILKLLENEENTYYLT